LREFAVLLEAGDSRARKLADGIAYRLCAVGQDTAAGQLKNLFPYDFKGRRTNSRKRHRHWNSAYNHQIKEPPYAALIRAIVQLAVRTNTSRQR